MSYWGRCMWVQSKDILPHHAFDGLIGLAVVFGALFLIVFDQDFAIYREIDELAYGHSLIYFDWLLDGDLEGPVAAEADVAFAGGGMDIDAEAAGGGFAFEEGDMGMGFGIFLGDAEIKNMWINTNPSSGISKYSISLCFFASRICSRYVASHFPRWTS